MKTRVLFFAVCLAFSAFAHPMGNFSISHYSRLEARPNGVELTFALDLAEIPTFELLRDWKLEKTSPRAELEAKALDQAREWISRLAITVDGSPVAAEVKSAGLFLAGGAGNLPVARITARAFIPAKPGRLVYEDRNFPDRAGWKEIVIAGGDGVALTKASHSQADISKALSAYPEDPAIAPPQELRARLAWAAAAPARSSSKTVIEPVAQPKPVLAANPPSSSPAAPAPQAGVVQKGDALSQLLHRQDLGLGALMAALALAFVFGAAHALSPGHGKTIVAAYLAGSRGTFKHALFLGGMVTFTHTVSVFLLGLGTMFLSQYIVPDRIYPILGAFSGLMIVFIGASLFYKRLRHLIGHTHAHHHHHAHTHSQEELVHAHSHAGSHSHHAGHVHQHDHAHDHHHHHHGPGGHSHVPEGEVTFASLVGLAVSGGMVPCPSALVLLLSAIALGRAGLGLLLLTSFSIGLAIVLIAIGCAVLYAKNLLPSTPRVTNSPFFRMLPVISAGIITVVGVVMTMVALGVVRTTWVS